jgi:ABC-type dipeptide/oligopeptide/nickel transport system ATPase subunit
MMWLNGNPVNFEFFRDKIFGTYMTFSSIAIVPQKLPSPLLVTGKLSQTIQELFFPTSGPSCPDTYLTRIKEEIKKTEDYVKRVDTQLKFLNEQSGQLKVRRFNAAKSITESTDKEEIEAHINDILTRISKHVAIVSGAQVVADLNQKHHEENKQFTNWKCREALAIDARKNIPNSTAAKLTLDDARDKLTAVIGDVNFDEFITDQIRKSKIYIIEKELEDLANKPTTYPDREYVQNALSIDSKYKEQCRAVNIQPYPLATISLRALEALKTEIINEEDKLRNTILQDCWKEYANLSTVIRITMDKYNEMSLSRDREINAINIRNTNAINTWKQSIQDRERLIIEREKIQNALIDLHRKIDEEESTITTLPPLMPKSEQNVGRPLQCPKCNETIYLGRDNALFAEAITQEEIEKQHFERMKLEQLHKKHAETLNMLKLQERNLIKSGIPNIPDEPVKPELEKVPEPIPKFIQRPIQLMTPLISSPILPRKNDQIVILYNLLRHCPVTIDVEIAQKDLKIFDVKERYQHHIETYGHCKPSIDIDLVRQLHQQYLNANNTYSHILSTIATATTKAEELERNLGPCPTVNPDLLQLSSCVIPIENYKDLSAEYIKVNKEISLFTDVYNMTMTSLTNLHTGYELILKERSIYLDNIMNQITTNVNKILEKLFDGHAKYALEIGATDKVSASIELHGRTDIDSLSLSGGELDRFSIAIAAAFTHFHKSPFLIFDETLAMLDIERRKDCIEIIKQIIPNTIIIFVTHDLNPDLFENNININDAISNQE